MSLPIVLRPEAAADIRWARGWYEAQRAGLGDDFAEAVDQLFARIQNSPEIYEIAHGNVRRGKLKRFPYVVYYRVHPDRIEVIAALHGSRHPRTWRGRI
jgi:plasmid stabilization system protein ParE